MRGARNNLRPIGCLVGLSLILSGCGSKSADTSIVSLTLAGGATIDPGMQLVLLVTAFDDPQGDVLLFSVTDSDSERLSFALNQVLQDSGGQGLLDRVTCPTLLQLLNDFDLFRERLLEGLNLPSNHDDQVGRIEGASARHHVTQHRAATQLVKHFGPARLHARPLTGGQDDNGELFVGGFHLRSSHLSFYLSSGLPSSMPTRASISLVARWNFPFATANYSPSRQRPSKAHRPLRS